MLLTLYEEYTPIEVDVIGYNERTKNKSGILIAFKQDGDIEVWMSYLEEDVEEFNDLKGFMEFYGFLDDLDDYGTAPIDYNQFDIVFVPFRTGEEFTTDDDFVILETVILDTYLIREARFVDKVSTEDEETCGYHNTDYYLICSVENYTFDLSSSQELYDYILNFKLKEPVDYAY